MPCIAGPGPQPYGQAATHISSDAVNATKSQGFR
jgi:hypothetical protein